MSADDSRKPSKSNSRIEFFPKIVVLIDNLCADDSRSSQRYRVTMLSCFSHHNVSALM